ncbi:TPA: filamentous hemagglutinin N-terminal domain-containing protein [Salmonella enterica subsp. enterica serovar Hvittingfoss]
MNKIYKLKYNRRRNQVVVVSEVTTGAHKEKTGHTVAPGEGGAFRRLLGKLTPLALLTGALPGMALAAPSLPSGGQVVAGQGSITTSASQQVMTIHQDSHGLVTNWNSFDIGKNHTVQFVQPDSSAVALNRVTGGHESQILGTLTANGQVMLVNPAGVMFGKGSKVNTAGMLASTKNISTDDFMAGRYTFSGGSHPGAEIVNQGSLTTTKGGYIVLAADRVKNSGSITTPSGKSVLASAEKVTLQLDNGGLTSVSVNGSVVNALVENSGLVSAKDGQVYLTARGKEMLLNTVVNNSGTVEAQGLSARGGEIVLDGGDNGVVRQAGALLADSAAGRGGKVTVQGKNIHLTADSRTSATGKTGGGEVYVGGGWQGKDASVRNASKVVMDKRAVINTSATDSGNGGTAVLWSDDHTNFQGTILAKGGMYAGNGGRVETSSRGNLLAFGDVEASAPRGKGGEWLLDPVNIEIVSGGTNTSVSESGEGANSKLDTDTAFVLSPNATTGSKVGASKITEKLSAGTNVTIKTTGSKTPEGATEGGNITVGADIIVTGSNETTLTLEADKNIAVNKNITSSSGKLNVNLLGAGSSDGNVTVNAKIDAKGGDVKVARLTAGDDAPAHNMTIKINGNIDAGNITLDGYNKATAVLPVQLMTGKYLNATGNISISGVGYKDKGVDLQKSSVLNASAININAESHDWESLLVNGATIKAIHDISINATGSVKDGAKFQKNGVSSSIESTEGNISIKGVTKSSDGGSNSGVVLGDTNLTASKGNITVTGVGYDSGRGALKVSNVNFSALNTVLNGTAGRNNKGVMLGGNINVTQGNLSVTGTINRTGNNLGFTGLLASGNINVSAGNLALEGDVTGTSGSQATALNLTGLNITANNASFTGVNNLNGWGILLNNVNLSGGIEKGNNITFSSCGSAAGANNQIGINGGLAYSAFEKLRKTGLDNNTTITSLTAGESELKSTFGFKSSSEDWTFDASSLSLTSESDKAGKFTVGGFSNITACTTGNISLTGLNLVNSNLTAANISLSGAEDGALTLTGTDLNASSGSVSLSANVAAGNGLTVTGGNITAAQNITLSGKTASGNGYGLSLNNVNMTATSGDITASGEGFEAKDGALQVNGGNFSAQNTVLSGTAGLDNKGAVLSGNINVTTGNLSLTGTTVQKGNGGFAGLTVKDKSSLNISVSNGNLSLSGQAVKAEDAADDLVLNGNTVGLNLVNTTLSANNLTLKGSSAYTGSGFILNNLNLSGNIAQGNNTTFSSAGSAANVTNTLDIKDGLGLSVFHDSIRKAGIENNTAVGTVRATKDELQKYTSFSESGDWTYDAVNLTKPETTKEGRNGLWSVGSLTGIDVTTTGNISLTGVSLTSSNLTGKSVTLKGAENGALTVLTTNLTASSGGINLSTTNGTLTVDGGVNFSATGGDVSLNGTSLQNGAGVKLNSRVNITKGNLTVSGTSTRVNDAGNVRGIDARGAIINVSESGKVLNMTGTVNGEANASGSDSVVGLDLDDNVVGNNRYHVNLSASSANLTGVDTAGGYGFRLNASLTGALLNADNVTLHSTGSGANVSNWIGSSVNKTFVQNFVEKHSTGDNPGSRTVVDRNKADELYNQANFTTWMNNGKLEKSFGDFVLSFTGICISASSINLTGASFINSTLTATTGDLTINNGPGSLGLNNTSLNASQGSITLTGGQTNLTNGTNLTAKNDITVTGSKGGVNITGNGSITSESGNISVSGDATGFDKADGVFFNYAKLNASSGNISVTGTGDQNEIYFGSAGIRLWRDVSLTSLNNSLIGKNTKKGWITFFQGGVKIRDGKFDFTGNTSINAHSDSGSGILFMGYQANTFLNFTNGTVSINASSGARGSAANVAAIANEAIGSPQEIFTLSNATLNINAIAEGGAYALFDNYSRGYEFQGNGSVNINASSRSGNAVSLKRLDNKKLNGSISITGSSQDGIGVQLQGRTFSLDNVTISGNSKNNAGVIISGNNNVLTNSSITGTSESGSGVNVSGNLNISGTTINAESTGTGTGFVMNGTTHISGNGPDKSRIHARSAFGDAAFLDGEPEVTQVLIRGEAQNGAGVRVGATVKNTGSVIDGSSGTGTGVKVDDGAGVEGGQVKSFSEKGTALSTGKGSSLKDVAATAKTVDGVAADIRGLEDSEGVSIRTEVTGKGTGIIKDSARDDGYVVPPAVIPFWPFPDSDRPVVPGGGASSSPETEVFRVLREAYEQQSSLPREDAFRQALRASGWQPQDKPVSVNICTDGECQVLEAGTLDAPVR